MLDAAQAGNESVFGRFVEAFFQHLGVLGVEFAFERGCLTQQHAHLGGQVTLGVDKPGLTGLQQFGRIDLWCGGASNLARQLFLNPFFCQRCLAGPRCRLSQSAEGLASEGDLQQAGEDGLMLLVGFGQIGAGVVGAGLFEAVDYFDHLFLTEACKRF